MYKPNFCAECGTRIERARWRVWTSRIFCDACAEHLPRRARLAWRLAACAALLVAGFALGRLVRPASTPPPLVIERTRAAQTPASPHVNGQTTKAAAHANAATTTTPADAPVRYGADGTNAERPTEAGEIVSICGARTKKGTPCSRRVRGVGRCWQHRGRAAILPPARLVVQGQ